MPSEIQQRLLEMGRWLEINGESVYGAQAFTLPTNQHDWGKITCKKTESGTNLYLHVFNWPLNKKLFLTGIKTKPEKVYLLADKQKSPLKFDYSDVLTTIKLSDLKPDPLISVIVVEYKNDPVTEEGLVAKSVDGGFSMLPRNQIINKESLSIVKKEVEGTVPEHVNAKEPQTFRWKIYIDEPGEKWVDVSYSFQYNISNSKLSIKTANQELNHKVLNTGKTVGEPNENWVIDNFKSNRCGKINFPEKGLYTIDLEVNPGENEDVKFQWLWIQ